MKKGLLVAVVSSLLLLPGAAPVFAAGGYVGLEGGAVWLSSSTLTATASVPAGDVHLDTGWGIGLAGGYDFGKFRLELELVYRSNDAKEYSDALGTSSLSGDMTSTALMVNGFYDFRMLSPHVIPYLGVGIGGANVSADLKQAGIQFVDDDDIVLAYQFVAGVTFPVAKQFAIDLNYRYFATLNPEFEIAGSGGAKREAEYGGSNLFVGLRYNF